MKLLQSKKGRTMVGSMAIVIIGTIISMLGIEMDAKMQKDMVEFSGTLVALIALGYKIAQGYADGKSGGKTSSSYAVNMGEAAKELVVAIESSGMELKQPRKPRKPKA